MGRAIGRITQCHPGSHSIPRSFDIFTATSTPKGQAVKISKSLTKNNSTMLRTQIQTQHNSSPLILTNLFA